MARADTPSSRSRLDKLGVKPGARVAVLAVGEPEFIQELSGRTGNVFVDRRRVGCDLIFLGVDDRAALRRIPTQKHFISRDGAIWVVWPKGSKAVNENDVRAAALGAGLVDVKVVAFSPTHSALKLVTPVKDR